MQGRRGKAPQGEQERVLGAVGKVSGGPWNVGGKTKRVTGTAFGASGGGAGGGQERYGIGARVGNRPQGEHFGGHSRGCVLVSSEGVSPFDDGQRANGPPGVPGGGLFRALVAFRRESRRKRAERRRSRSAVICT